MQIFPNPINGLACINFNNKMFGNYKIDIYNSNGQLTYPIFQGMLDVGQYNYNWNSTGNSIGFYFCKITGINTSIIYKIIVTK